MILKGISVNQDPPTKDYLWITPKGNTRFWNGSIWKTLSSGGGGSSLIDLIGSDPIGGTYPIYWTGSEFSAITGALENDISGKVNGYTLSSTVNAGTANYLAYYNSSNQIDDTSKLSCDGNYLHILNDTDVGGTTTPTNAPFTIGTLTSQHIEIDANEILSKSNGTIPSTLYLQDSTGYVEVAGSGLGVCGTNTGYNLYVNGTSYLNGVTEIPNLLYINDYIRLGQGGNVIDGYRKSTGAWSGLHLNYYSTGNVYICNGGGNVGIGTSSPSYKLHVAGTAHITNNTTIGGYLGLTQTAGAGVGISLYGSPPSSGAPTYGIMFATTNNYGEFGDVKKISGSSNTWATYFTMGTYSTDVNRGWIFRNVTSGNNVASISTNGNFCAKGGVTALATASSDKRLKKEIKPFNAKQIIDKLNPVEFEWNKKANKYNSNLELDKKNYGLIAQDSDGIIDNLVFDLPDGKGYKGVRYEKLIPILLQAVKEQQKEIDELKQIIKKLKV